MIVRARLYPADAKYLGRKECHSCLFSPGWRTYWEHVWAMSVLAVSLHCSHVSTLAFFQHELSSGSWAVSQGWESSQFLLSLSFVLAGELSASCSQEHWLFKDSFAEVFSSTTALGQLVFTLILFWVSGYWISVVAEGSCVKFCGVWWGAGSLQFPFPRCSEHLQGCGQDQHRLQLRHRGVKPPWLLNLLLPIMTCAFLQRFVTCVILRLERDRAGWSCKLP